MSGEQYKGIWTRKGDEFYEFQNPTQRDTDKQIIDKLFATGTSANRPTSATAQTGEYYYDSTFGVPLFWNGTAWQDATGATSAYGN